MSSEASQSSSRGWLGAEPRTPKSSTVVTSPRPKRYCHQRLTVTLVVRGFRASRSQLDRSRRSGLLPFGSKGCRAEGVAAWTSAPLRRKSPLISTWVFRGLPLSARVRAWVFEEGSFGALPWCSRTAFSSPFQAGSSASSSLLIFRSSSGAHSSSGFERTAR